MSITINGTTGVSGVDGSSTTPAFQGTDTNTGLFYGTDIVGISTGGSERVRVDASGNVGIGTTSPASSLAVDNGTITVTRYGSTGAVVCRSASGTQSSPTAISSATQLGQIVFRGYDGSDYRNTGLITGSSEGAISSTSAPGSIQFSTVPSGSISLSERMRIDSSGNVGIGTSSPSYKLSVNSSNGINSYDGVANKGRFVLGDPADPAGYVGIYRSAASTIGTAGNDLTLGSYNVIAFTTGAASFASQTERMRIDSNGNLLVGTTAAIDIASSTNVGFQVSETPAIAVYRSGGTVMYVGRQTNDGTLIDFRQAGVSEGSISVSGTTVSYNGGHLSRWSQWQNQTGQPSVYRGTVLESTNDMCEWEKDGEPLPNEQATKTIVSTTVASKAVAGVFDRYDEDDEDNPYDFYVAQSGDFVIRIAQGVVVQNGDLLESAGDGTAKPQADDICRSSTVAKVTSNYVSATYEDGSYCVPCILMIG